MINLHERKNPSCLRVNELTFSYARDEMSKLKKRLAKKNDPHHIPKTHNVLEGISFELEKGSIAVLGGGSGCGKSTLLRLIAGFEYPHAGEIYIENQLQSSAKKIVAPENRKIGLLFQDHALFPQMTIEENIRYGIAHLSKEEQQERIVNILQAIKLSRYAHRYPDEVSIGQMQRVALARALVINPLLLLLDEPFSSIDKYTSFHLIEEMRDIKLSDTTILMVTHEVQEALYLADKIMLMGEGTIQQEGTPENIYYRPRTKNIAYYFDEVNFLPVDHTICGQISTPCGFIPETSIENYSAFKDKSAFQLCIRPHMIQIKTDTKARYKGENWKVVTKYFMGNHHKIVLESTHPQFLGLKIIVIQEFASRWPQIGEEIQVRITSDRLWGLKNES